MCDSLKEKNKAAAVEADLSSDFWFSQKLEVSVYVYTKNKAKRKETEAQKDNTLYTKIPFQMSVTVHECKSVCTLVCVCQGVHMF